MQININLVYLVCFDLVSHCWKHTNIHSRARSSSAKKTDSIFVPNFVQIPTKRSLRSVLHACTIANTLRWDHIEPFKCYVTVFPL